MICRFARGRCRYVEQKWGEEVIKLQVFNGPLNDHEELVLVDSVFPFGLSQLVDFSDGLCQISVGLLVRVDLLDVKLFTMIFEDGHLKSKEDLDQVELASGVRISGEKMMVRSRTTGIVNSFGGHDQHWMG